MNPFFLLSIAGILTLTSSNVMGVETAEPEAKANRGDPRTEQMRTSDENVALHGPFLAGGASSGIDIATAVAIGVVGAALISYGEDEVQSGKPLTSQGPLDSTFASADSDVRSTATTTSVGTSTTIGIATTVSTTNTTAASVGTSSASAVSSAGSM